MHRPRHPFLGACALAIPALAAMPPAFAQSNFPTKPIMIIVPGTPGSAGDIFSRLYSQKIAEATGWVFAVENKPGAGAALGSAFVARSTPDGHTLLNASSSMAAAPVLMKNPPFDPVKSFTAISLLSITPSIVMVTPSFPAKNIREYQAYAKANPGKVNYGTTGIGSAGHLGGLTINQVLGTEVTYIHYKGAAGVGVALASGEIHISTGGMTANLPLVKSGKVRLLGVTSAKRNPMLPDVPTLDESGAKGIDHDAWTGIVGPAGIPAPIVKRLSDEFQKAGKHPEIVARLADSGQAYGGSTSEHMGFLIARETERYKQVVKAANVDLRE